jgi:hypothetical protein
VYPDCLNSQAPGQDDDMEDGMGDGDARYVLMHGDVWYEVGGQSRHVCGPSDLLAVSYDDPDTPCLMKHGEHSRVSAWAEETRRRLSGAGDVGNEMASQLVVVAFPPLPAALEALNWGLGRSGSIKIVIERIAALPEASTPLPAYLPR